MFSKSFKILKIESILKKKISEFFLQLSDKRLGIITTSKISLSKDLRYAKVYIFFLNKLSIKETIYILNDFSPYLRKQLSKKSNINFIPKISFYYDKSIILGNRINSLLSNNENKK